MPSAADFFDLTEFDHRGVFVETAPVWSALDVLHDYMERFFQESWALSGISGNIDAPLAVCGGRAIEGIEVAPSGPKGRIEAFSGGKPLPDAAVIMPGAFLYDDKVEIGAGTIVEPGALIKGPAIIGRDAEIRQGAYMRGDCIVGDRCVVGHATEMKASIMFNGAQAGHFAYVGDSILGNNVNLGAGTKLANLKMISGNIIVKSDKNQLETGRRKLGAILGDGTETGCNSVTSPGTLLSPGSIVYPGVAVPGGHYSTRTAFMPAKDTLRIRRAS